MLRLYPKKKEEIKHDKKLHNKRATYGFSSVKSIHQSTNQLVDQYMSEQSL